MRFIKYGVVALVAIIVLALAFVIVADRMAQPAPPDPATFIARAAHYDVRIRRDSWGVPHVLGKTDADVAFGLGFAHSEDDFATIQQVALASRGIVSITPQGHAEHVLSGSGLVGLALLPSGRAILAANSALLSIDWNVPGLPLLP